MPDQNLENIIESHNTIEHNKDIESIIKENSIKYEELNYKNETDLQQNIKQLIPPKDVFTSTSFLLQDSQNIFELQPTQRIEILKEVFDLLSIDQAKEIVLERKREIYTEKKILSETSSQDKKLQYNIKQIIESINRIKENKSFQDLNNTKYDISELSKIKENIQINNFSIPQELEYSNIFIQTQLDKLKSQKDQYEQKSKHMKEDLEKTQNTIKTIEDEVKNLEAENTSLKQKL